MPAKWKVLVNEPWDRTLETHRALEEAGCELVLGVPSWETTRPCYDEDQLAEMARDADAVMGASRERYTRKLFDSCPKLRALSKYGIGTEKIDVEAATEAGVLVGYTPVPESVESVCEYTLTLILNLVRRLDESRSLLREGGWRGADWMPAGLGALTVGIVGFGRIGRAVARRLAGWAGRVVAHDPFVPEEVFRAAGVEVAGLNTLLERSDVVTLHTVATPETRDLIGERALRRMKPSAYLVNTSRGEVVDEDALVRALREGWIAGAALDVFRREPPAMDNPLRSLPNAVLTPHFAWRTEDTLRSMVRAAAENLLAALRGEVPRYLKNPEALPRWRERFGIPG